MTRRRTNAHQPAPRLVGGVERHSIVVMMKPLRTKKMSTPIDPPWKSGEYQESQCSDEDGSDRDRTDAVQVVEPAGARSPTHPLYPRLNDSQSRGLGRSNPGLAANSIVSRQSAFDD